MNTIPQQTDESKLSTSPSNQDMIINLKSDEPSQLMTIGEYSPSKIKKSIKVKSKDRSKCINSNITSIAKQRSTLDNSLMKRMAYHEPKHSNHNQSQDHK
jgi:hypothetical protein